MSYEPSESFDADLEVIGSAAEALNEGDYSQAEAFDNAASLIETMTDRADEVLDEAAEEGEEALAQAETDYERLVTIREGLETLADGETPENVDEVTENVLALHQAYVATALKRQLAAAFGGGA